MIQHIEFDHYMDIINELDYAFGTKKSINELDHQYLCMMAKILRKGDIIKHERTGHETIGVNGMSIEFDCTSKTNPSKILFPILTCKKVLVKSMWVELEGFINGITDKSWYRERKCNIWNEWSNPVNDDPNDLGKIYGYQWNNFNGVNQLENLSNELKNNPTSRRMIVSAWNPGELKEMALEPCHVMFHVITKGEYMDLIWYQRSVDMPLGLPFNISSYGTLLILLAKTHGFKPRRLVGHLGDCHIYDNQVDIVRSQLLSKAYEFRKNEAYCTLDHKMKSIYDFRALEDSIKLHDYNPEDFVKFERAAV